jgi:hypothetical protein
MNEIDKGQSAEEITAIAEAIAKKAEVEVEAIKSVSDARVAAIKAETQALREKIAALKELRSLESAGNVADSPATVEIVSSEIEPETPEAEPQVEFKIGDKFIVDGTEWKISDILKIHTDAEPLYELEPEDMSRGPQYKDYATLVEWINSESKETDEKKIFNPGDKVTVDGKIGTIIGRQNDDGTYSVQFNEDADDPNRASIGGIGFDHIASEKIEMADDSDDEAKTEILHPSESDEPGQELAPTEPGELSNNDDEVVEGEIVPEGDDIEDAEFEELPDDIEIHAEMSPEDTERLDRLKATVIACHKEYIKMSRNKQKIIFFLRPKKEEQQAISQAYKDALVEYIEAKRQIDKDLGLPKEELDQKILFESLSMKAEQLNDFTNLTNELDDTKEGGKYQAIADRWNNNPYIQIATGAAIVGGSALAAKLGVPAATTTGRIVVGALLGGGIGGMARGAIELANDRRESRYLGKIGEKFEQQKAAGPLSDQEIDDLYKIINETSGYIAELQAKRVATGRKSEKLDSLVKEMISYEAEAEKIAVEKLIDEGHTYEEIMISLAIISEEDPTEVDLGGVNEKNDATSKNAASRLKRAVAAGIITTAAIGGSIAYSLLTADNANAAAVQHGGAVGGGGTQPAGETGSGAVAGVTGASQEATGTLTGAGDTIVNVLGGIGDPNIDVDVHTHTGPEINTVIGGGEIDTESAGASPHLASDEGTVEGAIPTPESETLISFSDLKMPSGEDWIWKEPGQTLHSEAISTLDFIEKINGITFTDEQRQALTEGPGSLTDLWQAPSGENEGLSKTASVRVPISGQIIEDILRNKGKL